MERIKDDLISDESIAFMVHLALKVWRITVRALEKIEFEIS
jgi:hypothetical protein